MPWSQSLEIYLHQQDRLTLPDPGPNYGARKIYPNSAINGNIFLYLAKQLLFIIILVLKENFLKYRKSNESMRI